MNELQREYRVAIAGCGKVAHLHAKAVAGLPQARLVGLWSRRRESAEAFAREYGGEVFDEIGEMVKAARIDLVIVCTPHPFHREPALQAAAAGASVLIDKPIASTLEDTDAIIDGCERAGVKLGVVSQRRWYEPAVRMKKAIDSGKIGRPILASLFMLGWRDQAYYDKDDWRGTWRLEGGGVLVNQAPHPLDLLTWYLGEIDEVYGKWANQNHPGIEVEDTAVATVTFKSGALASIVVSNSQNPGLYGRVHVHGSNGASVGVQTEGGSMFIAGSTQIKEAPFNDVWTVPGESHLLAEWKSEDERKFYSADPRVHYIGLQIHDMLEAIEFNRPPLVDGFAGRKTVELFTAIYRSTRDGVPVKFPLTSENDRQDMDGRLTG